MKWLKWENGTEWGEIYCPMLGKEIMTYYLKGRPCYDTYSAPFAGDGQVYFYRYDQDEDCWHEELNWLGKYHEEIRCLLG